MQQDQKETQSPDLPSAAMDVSEMKAIEAATPYIMNLYNILTQDAEIDLSSYAKAALTALNSREQTLLHYAARKNNVALLTKLIDTEYFDINARDIKGYTAADYSIKADNVDCLRLLINRGATDSGYVDKLNTGKAKFVEQATMFQTELSDHNELVILTGEDIANNVLDM